MCDKVLRRGGAALDEPSNRLDDYCSKKDSQNIETSREKRGNDYEDFLHHWPPKLSTFCPRASVYYAYTEDTNPFDRIEKFIENEEENRVNHVHFDPPLDPFTIRDPYEENAARAKYLLTPPVSFAIFGKPGLDTDKLANLLAEWWNCVLISPTSLMNDEIDKNSDKGKWIVRCLNIGESLGPKIMMNLVNSRVSQRDVLHRGYVVEGLPLIPHDPEIENFTCPEVQSPGEQTNKCCIVAPCTIKSEETSSSNIGDASKCNDSKSSTPASSSMTLIRGGDFDPNNRIDSRQRATIQDTPPEVNDFAMLHSVINPFEDENDGGLMEKRYEDYIPQQVERIFESWPLKPTVIIYVTCPDEDVAQRRDSRGQDGLGKIDKILHSTKEGPFDDERLEKIPIDSKSEDDKRLELRCEIYKRFALPAIERHVLRHNPQNFIRIEGRTTVSQMFEVVSTKLRCLPLSRAIIPRRMWDYGDIFEGEGSEASGTEDAENSGERITEEVFEELARKSTISSKFRWTISHWKFICPVELAKGHRVEGKIEFAVRFMNKIFFLSSMESMTMFLDNPRPFLQSMKPIPIFKIAIFGPRYSGKSELGDALGQAFQGKVIDFRELEKELVEEQLDANVANAQRDARHRIIEDFRSKLENERQLREVARKEALNVWFNGAKEMIQQLDQFRQTDVYDEEEETSEISVGQISRDKLREFDLQVFHDNPELLETVKRNETLIYDYAPDNLRNEEIPIRELSEDDPEVAIILENEVKHLRNDNIVITKSEMARALIARIEMIPEEGMENELTRKIGCIIDGMQPEPEIWKILTEAGVIFDYVVLITEESPYKNLLQSWTRYHEATHQSGENTYEDENEKLEKMSVVEDYVGEIKDFEEKWQNFTAIFGEMEIDPFIWKFDESSNVYEAVSKLLMDPYRLEAKIMTGEERPQEFENTIESVTDNDEEDDDTLRKNYLDESKSTKIEYDNRPFGDTGVYCPVALARNKVLWRGKEEYSALFLDKIYLCSSAEALQDFVKNPETFNLPFERPPKNIPPAHICIVGPAGSGKSTLAKALSTEYGIAHVNFSNLLDNYMRDRGIIPVDRDDEDRLEGIDLPQDLNDRKYNDDSDTILAFVQKYVREGATLPQPIMNECFLNFFQTQHEPSAIIFDSFPNCLEDVDTMFNNFAIPESVIELECSLEKVQERLLPELLDFYLKKQKSHKNSEEKKKDEEQGEDEEEDEEMEVEIEEEAKGTEHETIDKKEAEERILNEIEKIYERKKEMLDKARTRMEEESIPWIIVNTDENIDNLLPNLRKIVRPLIRRESSPFERTYQLDPYKADDLLECGYYLLSSFGRSCPVQVYEGCNPFQMYLPMDEKDEIYPIVHRNYIYFLASEEACAAFRRDPLKYLLQDSCDPVIPATISIVGPPKSGKSTLAGRFARAYGMRVIDRNDALHWTSKNYHWTETATEIEELSRFSEKIPTELFARCVDLYRSDYRSATQGYVLDGFPENREETEKLALANIRPMIVINLQADREFCLTSTLDSDEAREKKSVEKSIMSISQRYGEWQDSSSSFLQWLAKFAQNIVDIDATASKWAVWRRADRRVRQKFADIKRYFRESDYEKVHSLKSLLVTPYEFKYRQSHYKSYCPACLHHDDTLTFSGSPPDRRGVVQFRRYFYWLCQSHLEDFTRSPLNFSLTRSLPTLRAQIFDNEIDVEHACWARRLVADGNCVVTYADSLPDYVIVPGKRDIAMLYDDRLYLFCSSQCRDKFFSRASKYSKFGITLSEVTAKMATEKLTNLEYLKRTMTKDIIESITEVAAERPKYPGMSSAVSAAIYIGIHLKIHNVEGRALREIEAYDQVRKRLEARSRIINVAAKNIKSTKNPYDD